MNINEIESKEELLTLLNKGIDKFGLGFNELKENYNSTKSDSKKKNNTLRIRTVSQNEALIYIMKTDYANNVFRKVSEGKYYVYIIKTNTGTTKLSFNNNLYVQADWAINETGVPNNYIALAMTDQSLLFYDSMLIFGLMTFQDNRYDRLERRVRECVYDYGSRRIKPNNVTNTIVDSYSNGAYQYKTSSYVKNNRGIPVFLPVFAI